MLSGSILQKLVAAHQGTKRPLNLGVYYKNTLISLCHALEDFILESESPPLMISAFQQGKWYLQEAERYSDIAEKSKQIIILATLGSGFATHSTPQKSNVALVNLDDDDPVAQEWHLIVLSPTYTAMVLCQELSEEDYGVQGQPEEDLERKFYGFWTFEPELVRETVELAIAHVGRYDSQLQAQLSQNVEAMAAEFGRCQRDDLGAAVSKIVDYLQATHHNPQISHGQALDDNLVSNEMQAFLRMAQLIDQADAANPMAAAEVASLAEAMGQILDLPAWQVKRLRLTGLLHRLTPLQGATDIASPQSQAQQDILRQQGLLPKASVLRVMPQLQAIAQIATHQTECWDGSGQPEGLAYDAIPLESRILRLVADFQQFLTVARETTASEKVIAEALEKCQKAAGSIYDPKLVETLTLLAMGMQQGMNLQTYQPKIAAGIWLIEEDTETAGYGIGNRS
ncbi:MAG: DICT sensory domain-containing protein [Cyanobacteriota bacterium]|nr:DICT sensory domain-containing protein [Cyanobacteriota bacterium]